MFIFVTYVTGNTLKPVQTFYSYNVILKKDFYALQDSTGHGDSCHGIFFLQLKT